MIVRSDSLDLALGGTTGKKLEYASLPMKVDEKPMGEPVVNPVVARQVVEMLGRVVEKGSGKKAKVPGYFVAGKTGTSRKLNPQGYSAQEHVSNQDCTLN